MHSAVTNSECACTPSHPVSDPPVAREAVPQCNSRKFRHFFIGQVQRTWRPRRPAGPSPLIHLEQFLEFMTNGSFWVPLLACAAVRFDSVRTFENRYRYVVPLAASFRRRPESSVFNGFWTPAFAGVTEF